MSNTIVDMAKVTQMLDTGWHVCVHKGPMGSYEVRAWHPIGSVRDRLKEKLRKAHEAVPNQVLDYDPEYDWTDDERLMADDFTPEQALTRMAYKVHGEII